MPTNVQLLDIVTETKIRWRETYVSQGLNEKTLTTPKGIYRGFGLKAHPVTNDMLVIEADSVSADHLAVQQTTNIYSLTYHIPDDGSVPPAGSPQGSFSINLAAYPASTLVIALKGSYVPNVTSVGTIWAYDTVTFDALPVGTAVALGTVSVPGGAPVVPSYDRREVAADNLLTGMMQWAPLFLNSGFDQTGISGAIEGSPRWRSSVPVLSHTTMSATAKKTGSYGLLSTDAAGPNWTETGYVYQNINAPVIPGQHVKICVNYVPKKATVSGSVKLFIDWGSLTGATIAADYEFVVVDSATTPGVVWLLATTTTVVPATAYFIRRAGILFDAAEYTTGTALYLDDIGLWAEPTTLQDVFKYLDSRGQVVSQSLMLQNEEGDSTDLGALLRFETAIPTASEGRVIGQRKDRAASAWNPAFDWFGRMIVGSGLIGASATAYKIPRVEVSPDAYTTSTKTCIFKSNEPTAGTCAFRIFRAKATVSGVAMEFLMFTFNADWDEATTKWVADAAATYPAALFSWDQTGFYYKTKYPNTGANWLDSGWSNPTFQMLVGATEADADVVTLDDGAIKWRAPTTGVDCGNRVAADGCLNEVFAKNTCKAWGSVTTDGGGNVTLVDGVNCSVSFVGMDTYVTVDFVDNMADTNYAVIINGSDNMGAPRFYIADNKAVGTFRANRYPAMGGATESMQANASIFSFVVFGKQ